MRFLDEKGRILGKVSIVDLVIVLVVVSAGAWFAYAKFSKNLAQDIAAREQPLEYTILIPAIRPTTAEAFHKGDKVFEFKTGAAVGTITAVEVKPAEVWTINEDGKWVLTRDSGRVDAYVKVLGTSRVGENNITVNGVEIRVGLSISVTTKWVQASGNVLTMTLLEGTPK